MIPSERVGATAESALVSSEPYEWPMWTTFLGGVLSEGMRPERARVVREARIESWTRD